jgi:hypothetical protein
MFSPSVPDIHSEVRLFFRISSEFGLMSFEAKIIGLFQYEPEEMAIRSIANNTGIVAAQLPITAILINAIEGRVHTL